MRVQLPACSVSRSIDNLASRTMRGNPVAIDELDFTVNGIAYDLRLTVTGITGIGTVTAIVGTAGGETITDLNATFGSADNQIVSLSFPFVDYWGIGVNTSSAAFNIYNSGGELYFYDGTYDGAVSSVTFSVLCFFPGT